MARPSLSLSSSIDFSLPSELHLSSMAWLISASVMSIYEAYDPGPSIAEFDELYILDFQRATRNLSHCEENSYIGHEAICGEAWAGADPTGLILDNGKRLRSCLCL